jgi:hypothetical protein
MAGLPRQHRWRQPMNDCDKSEALYVNASLQSGINLGGYA